MVQIPAETEIISNKNHYTIPLMSITQNYSAEDYTPETKNEQTDL